VDSVLSPGVVVGRRARVVRSVVMHDCAIGEDSVIANAILDKDVSVGAATWVGREGATGGENGRFPTHLSGGITVVGKSSRLPPDARIGANVLIGASIGPDAFASPVVGDGECLLAESG
jgi:glucose-1-phosphate adenylyltransferase